MKKFLEILATLESMDLDFSNADLKDLRSKGYICFDLRQDIYPRLRWELLSNNEHLSKEDFQRAMAMENKLINIALEQLTIAGKLKSKPAIF